MFRQHVAAQFHPTENDTVTDYAFHEEVILTVDGLAFGLLGSGVGVQVTASVVPYLQGRHNLANLRCRTLVGPAPVMAAFFAALGSLESAAKHVVRVGVKSGGGASGSG